MIGTTSQWWRAFLYLTTVRGEIATYIEPWVDKISHQLDANLSAIDDVTFFCMPATMGVVIYLDGILTKIVRLPTDRMGIALCYRVAVVLCSFKSRGHRQMPAIQQLDRCRRLRPYRPRMGCRLC
jgi:hypothetical protein